MIKNNTVFLHLLMLFILTGVLLTSVSAAAGVTKNNHQVADVVVNNTLKQYYLQQVPVTEEFDKKLWQALDDLYFLSPLPFVWLARENTPELIEQAILTLEQAEANGLKNSDYQPSILRSVWSDLWCKKSVTAAELARFDIALSLSVLQYLSDLRYGRVSPEQVSFNLYPERRYDRLVSQLLQAIRQQTVSSLSTRLQPDLLPYQQLKQTLAYYRNLEQNYHFPVLFFDDKVEPGFFGPQISQLKSMLEVLGDFNQAGSDEMIVDELYQGSIVDAVKQFQLRHGLQADGVIGKKTLSALNQPISKRIQQIELALERWRWLPELPDSEALILVNIPAFKLWVYKQGGLKSSADIEMNVVVGMAKEHQTPVFMKRLQYLEFGPYWNVPKKIAIEEIWPKIQADPDYLQKHNMELIPGFNASDDASVAVGEDLPGLIESGQARIRQLPGNRNSLGRVKFIFPNRHAVYLHDTPARSLFYRDRRDFSHGCVRVQHPEQLAEYILGLGNGWQRQDVVKAMSKSQKRQVRVKYPFQVLIFYNTAQVIDDKVFFFEDIYHQDTLLSQKLNDLTSVASNIENLLQLPAANAPGIKMNKVGAWIIANTTLPHGQSSIPD